MPDPLVVRWRQRGRVAMWRAPDGRDSRWNISGDPRGCDSLSELLDLMLSARWASKMAIELHPPTAIPNGEPTDFQFANVLTLTYPKDRVTDDHWKLDGNQQLTLEVGRQRLSELKSGFNDIQSGNGDYTIGNEPDGIWFWWWIDSNTG